MCRTFILGLLTLMALLSVSEQGPQQRHLLRELLRHYNRMERPVENDSLPLTVRLSYTLLQVMELDEKNQILITNAWLQMQWYDHYLQWNQSDFPAVKNLRFTTDQIWIPDILLYNSAHDKFDATFKTNILVNSSGHCEYLPPGIFVSTCNVDVRWFPFDIQRCELKFGSWTFDGWLLDIQLKEADVSGFMLNGEWELLEVPGGRNEVFYDCCAEPYPDVTFVVTLRRRTLYYALNLLVPCVLLSSMTLLMFMLPASSGEKISLGITVLLSLTVFSLMIADIMPATSDSVPLIGQYFASTMVIVSMSVVATVIVLHLHHHDHNSGKIPDWVQLVLLHWVPRFLRMKRPERPLQQCSGSQSDAPSRTVLSPASSSSHNTNTNASSSVMVNTTFSQLLHLHPHGKLQPKLTIMAFQPQLNGLLPHNTATTLAEHGWRRSQYSSSNRSHDERGGGGETPVVQQQQQPLPPATSTSSSYSFSTVRIPPFEQRASPFDRRPSNSPEGQGLVAGAATTSPVQAGDGGGGGGPVPASHAQDGALAGGGGGGRSQAESPPPPSEEEEEEEHQMAALLAEVRYLVERAREQERRTAVEEDWHFAAAVLDRLCLLGFGLFNIVCTIAILGAAPNFGESLSKDFI